ncbi:MAG: RidA family protein [Actinobacteria bacterium]|nr:RidA family protein [Actinomycetota bacterium]
MPNEIVTAPELAPPVGYAHAVVAGPGRLVHLGGQTALDAEGKIVGEDVPAQLDVVAANVVAALRAAGGTPEDIVSVQIFVTDIAAYKAQLPALGEVWKKHFGRHYPASGLFGVTGLFDEEALIELMVVAVVGPEAAS